MNLKYSIQKEESFVTYKLIGKILSDLDYSELETEVFSLMNQNYTNIIFDLNDLTHTNSSGIGFFLRSLTKTRILNGELILIGLKGNVEKIFTIAKLNEVYTICETQEEANNHFKQLQ